MVLTYFQRFLKYMFTRARKSLPEENRDASKRGRHRTRAIIRESGKYWRMSSFTLFPVLYFPETGERMVRMLNVLKD
jgi:hypothetical protein